MKLSGTLLFLAGSIATAEQHYLSAVCDHFQYGDAVDRAVDFDGDIFSAQIFQKTARLISGITASAMLTSYIFRFIPCLETG